MIFVEIYNWMQLSGILLDTTDLQSANCTSKDKYTATLLIKGAGRFGFSGLYQICKLTIILSIITF